MAEILKNLEPNNVWKYFEEIAGIPHGSGDTKRISDYLVAFAKEKNLSFYQDESGNVVIEKEATKGCEQAEAVILQGHMDMVCEKEADVTFDFKEDGLHLLVDGDLVSATKTTLGGDDGIAVAYMLSILSDDSLVHPKLYAVFTVDEEIGMLGAAALDMSILKAKRMLNLDSEEEGVFLTGCAGGVTAKCTLPVSYEKGDGIVIKLEVSGLIGGHSGIEIGEHRGNADKILGEVLYTIDKTTEFRIISVSGGNKDNAIPRQAEAIVLLPPDANEFQNFVNAVTSEQARLIKVYEETDPDVELSMDCGSKVCLRHVDGEMSFNVSVTEGVVMMSEESHKNVIFYLFNAPDGVKKMSELIDDMVETSLNLGILTTEGEMVIGKHCIRSNVAAGKELLKKEMEDLIHYVGGEIAYDGDYPAWEYRSDSVLSSMATNMYEEMFQREASVETVHAGLECGLFSDQIEGLDCISYGPNIFDIHTPKERISISSVNRVYELTCRMLKELASE